MYIYGHVRYIDIRDPIFVLLLDLGARGACNLDEFLGQSALNTTGYISVAVYFPVLLRAVGWAYRNFDGRTAGVYFDEYIYTYIRCVFLYAYRRAHCVLT